MVAYWLAKAKASKAILELVTIDDIPQEISTCLLKQEKLQYMFLKSKAKSDLITFTVLSEEDEFISYF